MAKRPPTPDPQLLEVLICPLTHTPLDYDAERRILVSRKAGLAFPIRGGIPVLVPEKAKKIGL